VRISLSESRLDPSGDFRLQACGLPDDGAVTFHVRPLNQGAQWATTTATSSEGRVGVVIPAEAFSAYPLQWYVTVRLPGSPPVNLPGLGDNLCGRPYRVVSTA
jgi:hypothetical protein